MAPNQSQAPNPAEYNTYSAAVAQADPGARASAIQQFLAQYPNSGLRAAAISQMLSAQRQSGGNMPPGLGGMNRMASRQPAAMAPAGSPPPSAPIPVAASAPVAAVTGPPADSLLQHSPKPAVVSMASHSLSIQADNSTLSQILHEVSTQTGMKVEGLSKDDRIFGSYGPGDPHEVLLSLLEGCGYNVLMVGDTGGGAPRELTLSPRTAGIAGNSAQAARTTAEEDNDDDGDVQQAPPPEPVQTPPPAQPNENAPSQQRSPQEILQELRARQQNQNGAQPNPNPPQAPQ